jgi:hypothetical protein
MPIGAGRDAESGLAWLVQTNQQVGLYENS